MKRYSIGLVGVLLVAGFVAAQDEKVPTIKEIMVKLNKGPKSLCPVIGKELKDETINWDEIAKQSAEFSSLADALNKNKPRRGDAEKWTKVADSYAANVKELADAVEKKDKNAAVEAHKKLAGSCMNCHKDFR
jgi:cytochrome c556